MGPKVADGMANSVDPDLIDPPLVESDLGLHCFSRPVCPKTYDHNGRRIVIIRFQTVAVSSRKLQTGQTNNMMAIKHSLSKLQKFHSYMHNVKELARWQEIKLPYIFNHIKHFKSFRMKWTASSEFGTCSLCEQRRFRRACASAQSRQNLRCSLIQAVSQEEPSDRKPDPWPLWMAGHAQLKFVMTECSKTQIRLTGLKLNWIKCKIENKETTCEWFFSYEHKPMPQ